ncbi:MAG: putative DNA modification/repair radical SAM protein [Lachnospiraceae bacterium]|nr:putative DNA modification/repair radical SAM protein [Lachnospiraceae bacterium]
MITKSATTFITTSATSPALHFSKDLMEKLAILSDAAKYDVACTSSGVNRKGDGNGMGNSLACGICHSFSADGRCISLLKILYTNECIFNCSYCQNNCESDIPRATFTPEEVCTLTMEFYRRNYIEGLFLSSGIIVSPNYTMDLIYQTLYRLRNVYHFQGYIHVKAIPGADPLLIEKAGFLADRMSINLELPTADALRKLAPCKSRHTILKPMRQIQNSIIQNKNELSLYQNTSRKGTNNRFSLTEQSRFVPAGQSTQMIIGATPENDFQIMSVAEGLYQNFSLKRVFYSAFVNTTHNTNLPVLSGGPPLLREHRLYQADWLLRYYHFTISELLSEDRPNFNIYLDPKCDWALRHLEYFPVEINRADYKTLLRVPGIGAKSASRIVKARRGSRLDFPDLKKIGVVLKRALYFITCSGKMMYPTRLDEDYICRNLLSDYTQIPRELREEGYRQLSLFDDVNFGGDSNVYLSMRG